MNEPALVEDVDLKEREHVDRIQVESDRTGHQIDVKPAGTTPLHIVGVLGEAAGQTAAGVMENAFGNNENNDNDGEVLDRELIDIRNYRLSRMKKAA